MNRRRFLRLGATMALAPLVAAGLVDRPRPTVRMADRDMLMVHDTESREWLRMTGAQRNEMVRSEVTRPGRRAGPTGVSPQGAPR